MVAEVKDVTMWSRAACTLLNKFIYLRASQKGLVLCDNSLKATNQILRQLIDDKKLDLRTKMWYLQSVNEMKCFL